MRFLLIPHRLILYSVSSCQRVLEYSKLRGQKGKYNEEQGDRPDSRDSEPWGSAGRFAKVEQPCLVDIRRRGRNEENGDVQPIGGSADHTVIGVKENGDQRKSQ